MPHANGQARRRRLRPALPSLFGDSVLVRIRSITLGLLGASTAVCLGIVALIAGQGLPTESSLPIPGISEERVAPDTRTAGVGGRPPRSTRPRLATAEPARRPPAAAPAAGAAEQPTRAVGQLPSVGRLVVDESAPLPDGDRPSTGGGRERPDEGDAPAGPAPKQQPSSPPGGEEDESQGPQPTRPTRPPTPPPPAPSSSAGGNGNGKAIGRPSWAGTGKGNANAKGKPPWAGTAGTGAGRGPAATAAADTEPDLDSGPDDASGREGKSPGQGNAFGREDK